jgi:2-dehydropantoate 2-reductase
LVRPATAEQILKSGQLPVPSGVIPVRSGPGNPGELGVVGSARDILPDDAVLFTTKAPQLPQLVEQIRSDWDRGAGIVAGLQNGIGKDRVLTAAFGDDAVMGAITMTAAGRDAHGRPLLTTVAPTYFGALDGQTSDRAHQLAGQFSNAGLPASVTSDIMNVTWMKCCNSAALFGTSALTRLDTASLFSRRSSVKAFLDLLDEATRIAASEGELATDHPGLPPIASYIGPDREATIAGIMARQGPAGPNLSYSSMAQDILAGRATEVDPVIGELVRLADVAKLSVPRLRLVRDLLRALDEGPSAS